MSCRPRWENEALEQGGKFSREFWVVLCILLAPQICGQGGAPSPEFGFSLNAVTTVFPFRVPVRCRAFRARPFHVRGASFPVPQFPHQAGPPRPSAPSLKQAPSHASPTALFQGILRGYCHYGYYYYYYYYWDVGGALRLCRTRLWRARHPSKGRRSVTAPQQLRSPQLEEVMKQFMGIYKVMCE